MGIEVGLSAGIVFVGTTLAVRLGIAVGKGLSAGLGGSEGITVGVAAIGGTVVGVKTGFAFAP